MVGKCVARPMLGAKTVILIMPWGLRELGLVFDATNYVRKERQNAMVRDPFATVGSGFNGIIGTTNYSPKFLTA